MPQSKAPPVLCSLLLLLQLLWQPWLVSLLLLLLL